MAGSKIKYTDLVSTKLDNKLKSLAIEVRKISEELKKVKNSGKGMQQVNDIYNKTASIQTKIYKSSKLVTQQAKVLNKERQKAYIINKKNNEALNLKLQTEKQELLLKKKLIRDQAKLNAQKNLGVKANKGLVSSIKGYVKGMIGITAVFMAMRRLSSAAKEYINLAKEQIINQTKLTTVLKERTNATNDQVKSILALTKAQQDLGIIGDEVQIAGAQQFATFVKQTSSVKTLIPALNNLLAQQKGVNATSSDAVTIANLAGRAFQGQLGSLTRVGISFSEAEGKILKYGTESERAAALAKIITNNVGNMNEELAKTDIGRMKQLDNQLGDIKEQIGMELIPIMKSFKVISVESFKSILDITQDLTEPISLINDLAKGLKTTTNEVEKADLKWYDYVFTLSLFLKRSKETVKAIRTIINPIKALIKYNSILIKGLRKTLQALGLLQSEQAIKAGKIRERIDQLTQSFNALSKEQKANAIEDFKRLNEQYKTGEINEIAYMNGLNALILAAQDGTPVIAGLSTELDKLNKSYEEYLDNLRTVGGKEGKGYLNAAEDAEQLNIVIREMASNIAKAARVTDEAAGAAGGQTFFEKLFGTAEDRQKTLSDWDKLYSKLSTIVTNFYDTSDNLRERNAKKDKRRRKISKGLDIANATINTLVAATGAAKDTKGGFWAKALATALTLALGFSQVAKIKSTNYKDGTEYLHLNGNPKGTDTIPAMGSDGSRIMLNEGEGIVTSSINKQLNGFPYAKLPEAVNHYNSSFGSNNSSTTDAILMQQLNFMRNQTLFVPVGETLVGYKNGMPTGQKHNIEQ